MSLFLGVDAGGTSSKSRLTDAQGNVLGSGNAGPANTRMGMDSLHSTLLDVSIQAIRAAGLSDEDGRNVRCGMGIAGINRMGMKPQIQALPFPFENIQFTSDAMIANLGAHMGGDGAILIIGTGSVGLVKRGEDSFSIGGYGFPISDEVAARRWASVPFGMRCAHWTAGQGHRH
jgi:glucosamine kinase